MDNTDVDPEDHNYELAWSTAIWFGGKANAFDPDHNILSGLTITDCGFENCTTGFGTNWYFPPVYFQRLYDFVMEDCWANGILNGIIHLNHTTNGSISRCRMLSGGGYFEDGVTAGFVQHCQDITIDNCEFAYMTRDSCPDGAGFDFEGDSHNITFTNNVIHDCDGPAIIWLSSPDSDYPNSNCLIADNTFYNNNLNSWSGSEYTMKSAGGQDGTGTAENNGLYRSGVDDVGWWSGDWDNMSKINNRELFYSSVDGRPVTWEFNTVGDDDGWHSYNDWSSNTVSDGVLYGYSDSIDPYAHSSDTWANIHEYPFIRVRMKQSAGTTAQIYFVTETDGTWNEAKSVTFDIIPDYNFHEYLIDMRDCADYKGVVVQIRLDPTDAAASMMAIDYVRFSAN
jgi:hypothetical protein